MVKIILTIIKKHSLETKEKWGKKRKNKISCFDMKEQKNMSSF